MFDRDVYRTRRDELRRQLGQGIALFLGNDESPMNYTDNTYRFRQDSSFLYYFGLDTAGLAAILDLDEGTEALYGPELTVEDFVWTGPLPSLQDRAALAGVTRVLAPARLEEDLKRFRQAGRAVGFLPPYRPENKLKLMAWLGVPPDRASAEASVPFIRAVVEQRSVKSPKEVAEIEKAVDVSVDMHLTALRMARPGVTEAQIAAAVHQVARAAGGDLSFPIIATVHGEVLHQHAQTEPRAAAGRSFDAGGNRPPLRRRPVHDHAGRRPVLRAPEGRLRHRPRRPRGKPCRPSSRACRTSTSIWPPAGGSPKGSKTSGS
jgi:Xaa-Pro aminopeptidase